eukprot:gene24-32_t
MNLIIPIVAYVILVYEVLLRGLLFACKRKMIRKKSSEILNARSPTTIYEDETQIAWRMSASPTTNKLANSNDALFHGLMFTIRKPSIDDLLTLRGASGNTSKTHIFRSVALICWQWCICRRRLRHRTLVRLLELTDFEVRILRNSYTLHYAPTFQTENNIRSMRKFGTIVTLAYMDVFDLWKHVPLRLQSFRRIQEERAVFEVIEGRVRYLTYVRDFFESRKRLEDVKTMSQPTGFYPTFEARHVLFMCVLICARYHFNLAACHELRDAKGFGDDAGSRCCEGLRMVHGCDDHYNCDHFKGDVVDIFVYDQTFWGTTAEFGCLGLSGLYFFVVTTACISRKGFDRVIHNRPNTKTCFHDLILCIANLFIAHMWGVRLKRVGAENIERDLICDWSVFVALDVAFCHIALRLRLVVGRLTRVVPVEPDEIAGYDMV